MPQWKICRKFVYNQCKAPEAKSAVLWGQCPPSKWNGKMDQGPTGSSARDNHAGNTPFALGHNTYGQMLLGWQMKCVTTRHEVTMA